MAQSDALFGGVQPTQPRRLLQFKAGKLVMDSENWVNADPRKGYVYLYLSGDGKLHFSWIDRKSGYVEEDFILEPQQVEFKKVTESKSDRVYLLKFKNSTRFFVWMQEPEIQGDKRICSKINEFIKTPPPFPAPSNWLGNVARNRFSNDEILALLTMNFGSGLSYDSDVSSAQATATTIGHPLTTSQANRLLQSNAAAPTTTTTGAAATTAPTASATASIGGKPDGSGKFKLDDLRNIFSSIPAQPKDAQADLNDAINMNSLQNWLEKPEVQARLLPHLPPTDPEIKPSNDLENITSNVRSSQLKSTLKSFSAAFQTGGLAPLLAQFNLEAKANEAARSGDLLAFSRALQKNEEESASTNPTPSTGAETGGSKPVIDDKKDDKSDQGPSAMDLD